MLLQLFAKSQHKIAMINRNAKSQRKRFDMKSTKICNIFCHLIYYHRDDIKSPTFEATLPMAEPTPFIALATPCATFFAP